MYAFLHFIKLYTYPTVVYATQRQLPGVLTVKGTPENHNRPEAKVLNVGIHFFLNY